MDQIESDTHSFIVRIWVEETAEEAGQATWRGHVTHVPSGKRSYLSTLEDITTFIAPFLRQMGITIRRRRMARWLKR